MTKDEFIQRLITNGIEPDSISFDESTKDGYGIRRVYYRWEIFYRERGTEFHTLGFPSEEEALSALLNNILENRT